MFKKSITILLLTTAQEAFAKLSQQEVNDMVDVDIKSNNYTFETTDIREGPCTEKKVRDFLAEHFTEKHRCENVLRTGANREACLDKLWANYDEVLGRCSEGSEETDGSETTVVEPPTEDEPVTDPETISSDGSETTVVEPPTDDEPVTDPETISSDGQEADCEQMRNRLPYWYPVPRYSCLEIKEILDYAEIRLHEHNTRRRYHQNTPDVVYDFWLAFKAQSWAESMAQYNIFHQAPISDLQDGTNMRENIAFSILTDLDQTSNPEELWYDEGIRFYDWTNGITPDQSESVSNFTQMVWVNTTHIGCGQAKIQRLDESGQTIYYQFHVCRYSPPGNTFDRDGFQTWNVQPLK